MHKCLNIVSTGSSGGVKEGGMGKSFGEQSGKTRLMSSGAGRLFCRGLGFRLRGSCSVCRKCSAVSVQCSERVAMSSMALNGHAASRDSFGSTPRCGPTVPGSAGTQHRRGLWLPGRAACHQDR